MLTGPRRGEISALRWRHVDFERGLLSIIRSNSQPKAGLKEKSTKTGQARKIALDEHTVKLLTDHRDMWAQRCADLGVVLTLDAFLFSGSPDGSKPYMPRAISQRYRKLALKRKLRSTRLHSLRHYSATELVAAGVDIRTVAGRLGHGSGATTLKIYAAWVDEADRRAATTIAAIVPKPIPAAPEPRGPYEVIAEALRAQIRSGQLQPGDPLPTVAELAVANTVAVGTAHRALALLKAEGLVTVARGRRAVVAESSPSQVLEVDETPRPGARGRGAGRRGAGVGGGVHAGLPIAVGVWPVGRPLGVAGRCSPAAEGRHVVTRSEAERPLPGDRSC